MKIAVTCGPTSQSFLPAIERVLREGGHEVQRFTFDGAPEPTLAAVNAWRADAIWHEWADSYAATLSRLPTVPVVIRAHRYEFWTPEMDSIDWRRVRLVTDCQRHLDMARARTPKIAAANPVVIPVPVDFDLWPMRPPLALKPGVLRLGMVAYWTARKDPIYALEVAASCGALGRDVELHLAGKWRDMVLRDTFIDATRWISPFVAVFVNDWVDDLPAWWEDKDACLVTSWDETGPCVAIEALALGIPTVVRHHPGSGDRFPGRTFTRCDAVPELLIREIMRAPSGHRAAVLPHSLDATRGAILALFGGPA